MGGSRGVVFFQVATSSVRFAGQGGKLGIDGDASTAAAVTDELYKLLGLDRAQLVIRLRMADKAEGPPLPGTAPIASYGNVSVEVVAVETTVEKKETLLAAAEASLFDDAPAPSPERAGNEPSVTQMARLAGLHLPLRAKPPTPAEDLCVLCKENRAPSAADVTSHASCSNAACRNCWEYTLDLVPANTCPICGDALDDGASNGAAATCDSDDDLEVVEPPAKKGPRPERW